MHFHFCVTLLSHKACNCSSYTQQTEQNAIHNMLSHSLVQQGKKEQNRFNRNVHSINPTFIYEIAHDHSQMKSSDAKASKCHLKCSSRMIIFIKLAYLSSVISLKWQ